MSGADLNWEQLPEAVVEAFSERLELVELLLDPLLPEADKRAEQRRYQHQHGVGERTIRGYLQRYRQRGPRGLLFYRPRPTSPRVHDPALRAKLLDLINELPTRSVSQLRKLIAADAKLGPKIARISDRTVYRFLAEHGLTKSARYLMLADDARTSFRSFEAPTPWLWCRRRPRRHLARHSRWPQENLPVPVARRLLPQDPVRQVLLRREAACLARQLSLLPVALRHPGARLRRRRQGLSRPPPARHPGRAAYQAGAPPALFRPTARARSRPPTRPSRTSSNAKPRSPACAPSMS